MINDILKEAILNINEVRRCMPHYCADLEPGMRVLVAIMISVKRWMEAPKTVGQLVNAGLLRELADWLDNPELPFPGETKKGNEQI